MAMRAVALMVVAVLMVGVHAQYQPQDPIMAVVSLPFEQGSVVESTYVRWLEQAGARAVPLLYDSSTDVIDDLLTKVNGVLFTGGGLPDDMQSTYMQNYAYIMRRVVEMNARGDTIVTWSVCQGFQMLSAIFANTTAVIETGFKGTFPGMLPLNFTSAAPSSRMFGELPADVFDYMANYNTTTNDHTEGIAPASYVDPSYPGLNEFDLLSVNYDAVGRIFASSIEHKKYPIYAVQWHAEVTQFFRLPGFKHGPRAVRVSQYMAIWLVEQLRKTKQSFPSIEDASQATMLNYLVRVNATTLNSYYLFPK